MIPLSPRERILVAIDTPDLTRAAALAQDLKGLVGGIKLGKEFFTTHGPDGARAVASGQPLFLDLKFHDIPNTVAGAIRAACHLHPLIVNVHASGGRAMMEAAAQAAREASEDLEIERPAVIGVTLMTSLDEGDLADIGYQGTVEERVVALARLSRESGLDGVVCSAREIGAIREACGPDFLLVVPGIRPHWAGSDDQKRIMTPAQAVAAGADYLVIGRPITGAGDPAAAARRIVEELEAS